jgi:hypothetical protein
VIHVCNPGTQETEAGCLVSLRPAWATQTLSQKESSYW